MTTRKGPNDLNSHVPFKKPKLQPPVDTWGDDSDDDDLIMLASQKVEQEFAAPNSFQAFLGDIETSDPKTSTQRPPVAVNVALRASVTSSVVLNHQDKASQDFLRRRIETLERELQRTKEDCRVAQEKCGVKDYEVSSLKCELKELQRGNSELRMKLVKNEQFNREIQKNKAIERQLQKTEADLELTRLELLKLKSGNSRRMSTQAAPQQQQQEKNANGTFAEDNKQETATKENQIHINLTIPRYSATPRDSWQLLLSYRIFENPPADVGMGTIFVDQLTFLQRAVALVLQGHALDVDGFVKNALTAVQLSLNCISLKFDSSMQNRSRRNILSDHEQQAPTRSDVCIYDKEPLYKDEELIVFRRILSLVSLTCKLCPKLRAAFFSSHLCDSLLEVLQGLSRTTDEYQRRTSGIVQASAVILLNLVKEGCGTEDKIPLFFKALTFSRLDCFALFAVIKSLGTLDVEVTKTFLCRGCDAKECVINGTYSIAQFTTNSCLLQILATSIECVFPFAVASQENRSYWTVTRYRSLLAMAKCLMQFLRKSIREVHADWLQMDRPCFCYVKLTTSVIILAHLCLHLFHTVPKLRTQMRQMQTVCQLTLLLLHDIFTANLQMKLLQSMGRPIKNRLIVVYNLLMHYNDVFHFRLAQVKALESFEVNLLSNSFVRPTTTAAAAVGRPNVSSAEQTEARENGQSIWDGVSL